MAKVIVIGGGAAGIMAAIVAARNGSKVTLLERKDRIGKKILATGNGRCNISNRAAVKDNYHSQSHQVDLIQKVLKQFTVEMTVDFFECLGIPIIEKEKGKLYPRSLQAGSVVSVLLMELKRLNINIETNTEVKEIICGKNYKVITGEGQFYANKLIIACGGKSSPDLGSNGSGFTLAKKLGHHIVSPFPSIVQLKSDDHYLKHLKGTKIDGNVSLFDEEKRLLREEFGEVLFTDYGVSGPPILQVSYYGAKEINRNRKAIIEIDMANDYSDKDLDQFLIKRFELSPTKTMEENLVGFIKQKLIIPLIKRAQIDLHKKSCDVTKEERKRLVHLLKHYDMKVTGTHQWNQSQVTAGGVSLDEIDIETLESKLHKGLYFCGEILDVDGDCGGYNLQFAWSSGFVAGNH